MSATGTFSDNPDNTFHIKIDPRRPSSMIDVEGTIIHECAHLLLYDITDTHGEAFQKGDARPCHARSYEKDLVMPEMPWLESLAVFQSCHLEQVPYRSSDDWGWRP